MSFIPFGSPEHPWRTTSEHARKAGKASKAKSPWAKSPMVNSKRALSMPFRKEVKS